MWRNLSSPSSWWRGKTRKKMRVQICWTEGYQQSNWRQWPWRECGHTAYGATWHTQAADAPSRVGTFFIRLYLSHWQWYQQSSYLLIRQSQILQEQSDWTNNIYYHSLEYWHKFPHWKLCSVKRHKFNYGMAFRWEERTFNTVISLQHRQTGFQLHRMMTAIWIGPLMWQWKRKF